MSDWEKFIQGIPKGGREDRIIGMIYGHALGDAVGLLTEFRFKKDIPKIEFPYANSIRDFPICDWTEDTDHLIITMQSLIDNDLKLNTYDIADRLRNWQQNGFKDLGDTCGKGLGQALSMVISNKKFLESPHAVSTEFWHNSGMKLATNGALMRTSILGALPDRNACEIYARELSAITHSDPRCIISCVLHSLIIGNIIHKDFTQPESIDQLLADCVEVARKYINNESASVHDNRFKSLDDELSQWVEIAYTKNISELHLDDMFRIDYTFKCLSCGIYSLQVIKAAIKNDKVPSFRKFITKIVAQCGDADTNAAIAGSAMGAYLGYSRLPADWINSLPNKNWLNEQIMKFLTCINVITQADQSTPQIIPTDTTVPSTVDTSEVE